MLEIPWQTIPMSITWGKSGTSRSGGTALDGSTYAVGSGGGFWTASVEMLVRREEAALAWRAFCAAVDGVSTPFLIPAYSRWRPRDTNGRVVGGHSVGGMSHAAHSELFGFGQEEPDLFRTIGNATLRDTRLTLAHTGAPALRPGHYFGIGERLYLVARAWSVEHSGPVQSGGGLSFGGDDLTFDGETLTFGTDEIRLGGRDVQVVDFWPPLRASAPHDTSLIVGSPVCKVRLAADEAGALSHGSSLQRTVGFDVVECI